MRTATGLMETALGAETSQLARLWTITRLDSVVVRLTDHDQDITHGGDLYSSQAGFTCSAVLSAAGVAIQGMTMTLVSQSNLVSLADIIAHVYDGAASLLRIVDWTNPDGGYMDLFGGTVIGATVTADHRVELEVNGLMSNDRYISVESYGSMCRADLGDARCQFDINSLRETFTIDAVTNVLKFSTLELGQADSYWDLGVLRFLSGLNAGVSVEVRKSTSVGKTIELFVPAPFSMLPGDTGEIWPGCDKALSTCHDRYNNVVNFRGEPVLLPKGS